ncbi:hypothetical protein PVNG_06034 [Plasmodium vivax North Korean]|uniref:Variable surface protein Vir4 n=1 Tax=Plasmodium vivax North Korean TaxID=1035514 RepID=A0A0J9W6G7_PLAVI|nr:hypothetical protein PVNG_06034 [Plasmodium vivax North Korean]
MDNDFSNLNTYENICNEKLFSRKKPQMMPICKKYLRFLDNSEVWGGTGTEYDVSLLLNYWLYHNISAIYGITNFEKISDDFSALQLVGYYFKDDPKYGQNYEKFKPNINIFKEKDWEKRKELYEYYVNYDTLFWTAQSFNNKCEEYYGKIKKMILVYKLFEEKCSSKEYECPGVFYKCEEKNLESSLKTLPCHHTITDTRSSTLDGDSPYQSPRSAEQPLDPVDRPAAESNTQLESGDSGIREKVTNSYTPFGSWIRKLRGGHKNSMSIMDGVPSYMQETGDVFSDHEANYISYQPM